MSDTVRVTFRTDNELYDEIRALVLSGECKNNTHVVTSAIKDFVRKNYHKIEKYDINDSFSQEYLFDVVDRDSQLRKEYGIEVAPTPFKSVLKRKTYCGSNGKLITEEEKEKQELPLYYGFKNLIEREQEARKTEKRIIPLTPSWEEIYKDLDKILASNGMLYTNCNDSVSI
ncbi:MAG: hypothetical protein KAT37_02520 [Candidatus Aenigmarchaeota archaeon]|nr:hypothetical protein [Candidatus Aenigmarchaeota archaeon]